MNNSSDSDEEDKSNQIDPNSPDQSSIDMDSETFNLENFLDHSQFSTYQIPTDQDLSYLQNHDIGDINVEEESTLFECSNMSSAPSSQSQEGNTHEGQIVGIIDLSPTAVVPEKRRRRCRLGSLVLGQFFTRSGNEPKKEYIRLRVLRGHKKANRQIIKNEMPLTKGLHTFAPRNGMRIDIWNVLRAICLQNISTISQSCRTENGPVTDGKAKRATVSSNDAKTCNNEFCKNYFSIKGIPESYFWYIELIFAEASPSLLCHKFEIFCCSGNHSMICAKKWETLHFYLNKFMILDLKVIAPWFPPLYWQNEKCIEDLIGGENEKTLSQYTI